MGDFKDLKAWQYARRLAVLSKEFRKFLDIARASLHEIEAILNLIVALGYLRPEEVAAIEATRAECAKTVYGLLRRMDGAPRRT